jgi:hypothetical protein
LRPPLPPVTGTPWRARFRVAGRGASNIEQPIKYAK